MKIAVVENEREAMLLVALNKAHGEIERLRDLLAWNGINPDAIVDSAKGAERKHRMEKEVP